MVFQFVHVRFNNSILGIGFLKKYFWKLKSVGYGSYITLSDGLREGRVFFYHIFDPNKFSTISSFHHDTAYLWGINIASSKFIISACLHIKVYQTKCCK